MLETERTLTRLGFRHWELLGLAVAAALAGWEARPSVLLAVVAALAGLAIPVARSGRRVLPVLLALTAMFGGAVAGTAAWRIRAIESQWGDDTSGVRGALIDRASQRLAADLASAVASARELAERAVRAPDGERLALGATLRAAVEGPGLERGVVVFRGPEPWIWAGRHRLRADPDGPELSVRITPFYVVLEARRQHEDRVAVAQVTLAADSAVPQRREVLADRFQAATGVGLRFYPASRGPREADVFDYCIPSCSEAATSPDTLFGVRMDPPGQGPYKVRVEVSGRRRVALALASTLLLLLIGARGPVRLLTGVGAVLWLVLSATGQRLWPGGPFSAATYYVDVLGPVTTSAAALGVTGAAVLVLVAVLAGRGTRPVAWAPVPVGFVLVGLVAVLPSLASGITPPSAGPGLGLWLLWQVALTLAIAAPLFAAALLLRQGGRAAPPWMTVAGLLWAVAVGLLGLLGWGPEGWPRGFMLLWLPAMALVIQPAGRARALVGIGLVAGGCAAVLTWGAVAEGRLTMAARDVAALRRGGDPIAVGLLERLGLRMRATPVPGTVAGLYAQWTRSPLAVDGYPAMLALWRPGGEEPEGLLALAELGVPPDSVRAAAHRAREDALPILRVAPGVPALRYILAVPWADGTVATIVLGPRSRVVPPERIARFLRGDPVRTAPYTVTLSEPVAADGAASRELTWRREGAVVRGEELLRYPDGTRHVHATVPLGTVPALPVRGALLLLLNLVVLGLLVGFGDALAGRVHVPLWWREFGGGGSFRARLALALVVFFVVPTVVFATWTARRLDAEASRSRDLVIRQTLQDAAGTARGFAPRVAEGSAPPTVLARQMLQDLGGRLGADLMLFMDGELLNTVPAVLADLGVVDPYLPQEVLARMVGEDVLEVEVDQQIAGRATRVGYRAVGSPPGLSGVLAAPRLAEDPELVRSEQDLTFALVLITLLGIAAALGFATLASRTLARPVRQLREAALRVGRGDLPEPMADVPYEFRPVADAFVRMAQDVERGRVALEAQRARTAAVLRSVATGVIALDDALRVIAANQRAEDLLGRPAAVGAALTDTGGPDWRPVWGWIATQARARAAPEPAEFTVGEREIRVQLAPLAGAASGWVVAFDDTTERTRAVRVLAWGELARQIAHEIKNPLTPIRLGVQHLERSWQASRADFGETLGRTSRQILAEIERLDAVARAFSRFGAPPEATGALERVDVAQVAREIAGLYALGETPRVAVEPDTPVLALARRDELKEVLVNLVDNARNAEARRVDVLARPEQGRVLLTVQDDGRGIMPADLPRIFEPRFSTTTSGAGLGLAISRRLVESWGGTVTATSRPGAGTTLTLELLS